MAEERFRHPLRLDGKYAVKSCSLFSVDGFQELVADALHAGDGRVSVLLVDVVQFNQLDVVMLADFTHGLIDGLSEF